MVVSVTRASQPLCMVSGLPIPNNFVSFFLKCEHSSVPFNLYSITIPHIQQPSATAWARWYLPSFTTTTTTIYICVQLWPPYVSYVMPNYKL